MDRTFTPRQIQAAFGLHPTTLRKWLNGDDGEHLHVEPQDDRERRWRRFTLTDSVRLCLLSRLTGELQISSRAAIHAVNALFETIGRAVTEISDGAKRDGAWPIGEGPWVFISSLRSFEVSARTEVVRSKEQLRLLVEADTPPSIILDFCALVRMTVIRLSRFDVRQLGTEDGSPE